MTREAQQPPRHGDGARDLRIGDFQSGLGDVAFGHVAAETAPLTAGQPRRHILGQTQDLADLANGAARSVTDDRRRYARPVPPIPVVDVLNDLLAPLMFEIDVDIRRLVSIGRQEAFEQKIMLAGIDRGDPQHIADGRIRRRSSSLTQDALVVRDLDNVVDGQEIGRQIALPDVGELLVEIIAHLLRRTLRIFLVQVSIDQVRQPVL